jgi:hypothetical protein
MSSEEAIIEIDVGLTGSTKSEIDEYLAKLNEIKSELQEVRGEGVAGEEVPSKTKDISKKLTADQEGELSDFLGKLDEGQLKQLQGLAKNPTSFIEGQMGKIFQTLGPRSAMMVPIVGAVVASAVLYIEIMKALSVKGGPFNRDWRRFLANEVEVGINRELQKRKELGIDQVVIAQQRGFTPNNPEATYNSLYEVNESRIARIGLSDRGAGVTVG